MRLFPVRFFYFTITFPVIYFLDKIFSERFLIFSGQVFFVQDLIFFRCSIVAYQLLIKFFLIEFFHRQIFAFTIFPDGIFSLLDRIFFGRFLGWVLSVAFFNVFLQLKFSSLEVLIGGIFFLVCFTLQKIFYCFLIRLFFQWIFPSMICVRGFFSRIFFLVNFFQLDYYQV